MVGQFSSWRSFVGRSSLNDCDFYQCRFAVGAQEFLRFGKDDLGLSDFSQEKPDEESRFFGSGTHEAKVSEPDKPLGQDVLKPSAKELIDFQMHLPDLLGFTVLPLDGDLAFRREAFEALIT